MPTDRCIICDLGLEHTPENWPQVASSLNYKLMFVINSLISEYMNVLSTLNTEDSNFSERVKQETMILIEKSIRSGIVLEKIASNYMASLAMNHSKN